MKPEAKKLEFYGGLLGALAPFLLFITGAVYLGINKSPDVSGYLPITTVALIFGMVLSKNRSAYTDAVIDGMAQKILMIMVAAWLFASIIGTLMYATGFVEALVWVCWQLNLKGRWFAGATFLIAALVGTSTGTSIGTIITCAPILYPAGYLLGANPVILMGAIVGGGAFGDCLSPLSDTTIASALTQYADIGGMVKDRLRYTIPAAALALVLYVVFGKGRLLQSGIEEITKQASPAGLPMLIVPAVVLFLCLKKRHLVEALFWGILIGCITGLVFGLIIPSQLFSLDVKKHTAGGIILDGMRGGIDVSIFTILLLGLIYSLQRAGVITRLINWASRVIKTVKQTDFIIMLSTIITNLLTAHNTVTIVSLGEFARQTGERFKIHPYRRANILDVAANTFQHIVPYMTTVIIASAYTSFGEKYGAPKMPPLIIGLSNFQSWALLLILIIFIFTGYGHIKEKKA